MAELAAFFGVTLDYLFSLGADDHIARIDAMLRDDFIITDENFVWAERYLKGALSDDAGDSEARVRLIELYRHRANRATLAARHFAEAGVRADADEVRFHRMYLNVSRERRELDRFIGFYEDGGAGKTPNAHAVRAVIEACLEDRRLEKAKSWLAKLEDGIDRSLYEGDISLAEGDVGAARDVWLASERYAETYQDYLHIAERFDKIHDCDTAVRFYVKSGESRTRKGALDYAYSLAFLYEKLGRTADAAAMWETIVASLASDWGITSGETVDWPLREIARLRKTDAAR